MKMYFTMLFILVVRETNHRWETSISNHLTLKIPFRGQRIKKYIKMRIKVWKNIHLEVSNEQITFLQEMRLGKAFIFVISLTGIFFIFSPSDESDIFKETFKKILILSK